MYNCARLATLFDTYERAVERGEHQPHQPPQTATAGPLLMPGATGASLGTKVSHLLARYVPSTATSARAELLLPAGRGESQEVTCMPPAPVVNAAGLGGPRPL